MENFKAKVSSQDEEKSSSGLHSQMVCIAFLTHFDVESSPSLFHPY